MRRLAFLLVLVGVAHADPQTADKLAAEADALALKSQFSAAAQRFREAYRAEPRPELMCNVGVAYYKAKDLPRAQRYLEQCVQIGSSVDRGFIDTVKQVLASLDTALRAGDFTPVSFLIDPMSASITARGNEPFDEPILGSRVVWFPYGSYSVVIHAEGFIDQTIDVSALSRATVDKSIKLVPAPVVKPIEPVLDAHPIKRGPPPEPPSRLKPIVVTALAVATGAAAGGFYLLARKRATDAGTAAQAMPPDKDAYDDAKGAARTWQGMAIGFAIGAAIEAGLATYFWIKSPAKLDVEPMPGGAAVSFSGRF